MRSAVAALFLAVAACGRGGGEAPGAAGLGEEAAVQAFAESLRGAELVVDGDRYHIADVQADGAGAWTLSARFRFQGIELALPVPVEFEALGTGGPGTVPTVMSVVDLHVLGFGPYRADLVFAGERWAGVWSGPGAEGGQIAGMVLRPDADD